MKKAILLVDHGSRRPEANAILGGVAALVARKMPEFTIHVAHMDLASPTVSEGFEACVGDGATEVTVHPYFFGPGNHTTHDIPRLVAEAASAHPEITVRISEPLGIHEKIAEVIAERIAEAENRGR